MEWNNKICAKDAKPEDTVAKIKKILLEELGCETREIWLNSVKGVYSVRIEIIGTHIGANGKGISKELTLASGYGELMERLQNMINFRMSSVYKDQIQRNCTYVCPDQIIRRTTNLEQQEQSWIAKILKPIDANRINNKLMNFSKGEIIELPYKKYQSSESILVPYVLGDIIYGSNGMAAGNTKEEAMVQGISEILERYMVKNILAGLYSNDGHFSEITNYVLNEYSWIKDIVNECENAGYKIHILDMGDKEGLPVLATIFLNKKNLEYFVNFGSHPLLEIAVERTLSELMQGREIQDMAGMTKLENSIKDNSETRNRNNIFINGSGIYPYQLFCLVSKEPSKIWKYQYNNNKDMLEKYIELIDNMGKTVYYRDMGFLGFPAYHIIIPGISEITEDVIEIEKFFVIQNICDIIKNIDNATEKEIEYVIKELDDAKPQRDLSLLDLLQLPISNETPNVLSDITLDLMMMMLCAYINDYERANRYTQKYINYLYEWHAAEEIMKYYRTIRSIFNMKQENIPAEQIKSILIQFLELDYIEEVLEDVKHENLLKNFPKLKCLNCNECIMKNVCCYKNEEVLYNKLIAKAKNYY